MPTEPAEEDTWDISENKCKVGALRVRKVPTEPNPSGTAIIYIKKKNNNTKYSLNY